MFSVLIYTGQEWKGSLCVWRIFNKRPQASRVFSLSLCWCSPWGWRTRSPCTVCICKPALGLWTGFGGALEHPQWQRRGSCGLVAWSECELGLRGGRLCLHAGGLSTGGWTDLRLHLVTRPRAQAWGWGWDQNLVNVKQCVL